MLPLLGALVAFLVRQYALPWLALLTAAGITANLTVLTMNVWQTGPLRHPVGGWGAPLGIDLYLDGLSLLMLWLTGVVGSLVSGYALAYFRTTPSNAGSFWPLWLLLWSGLNALFLSADIFNFYVTLEMLTLAAVPLVSLAGGQVAFEAAIRYLLYALLGSLVYLLGVALIYAGYGTLATEQLQQVMTESSLTWLALALISVGLITKMALFPLHIWLPKAHANAPAPVSALLSALVVKGAFYLLLRFWFYIVPQPLLVGPATLLGILGAAAIFYGSLQALQQTRLKLLIAYSTVAQLGYLMLIFPLPGSLAWAGVIFHTLSHGLAKAALFLAAGNMLYCLGHDRLADFTDPRQPGLPLAFLTFALASIAIMGLPPSGGFLAKWLLLQAALESGQWWWAVVILSGGLLAAAYIFRVLKLAFTSCDGPIEPAPPIRVASPWMSITPLLLALLALLLGFTSAPLLDLLDIGSPFPLLNSKGALL
jgi:formate hydrogenlyase subunit 3/multisubunit Na+/H+ antiporter MnhD subunit